MGKGRPRDRRWPRPARDPIACGHRRSARRCRPHPRGGRRGLAPAPFAGPRSEEVAGDRLVPVLAVDLAVGVAGHEAGADAEGVRAGVDGASVSISARQGPRAKLSDHALRPVAPSGPVSKRSSQRDVRTRPVSSCSTSPPPATRSQTCRPATWSCETRRLKPPGRRTRAWCGAAPSGGGKGGQRRVLRTGRPGRQQQAGLGQRQRRGLRLGPDHGPPAGRQRQAQAPALQHGIGLRVLGQPHPRGEAHAVGHRDPEVRDLAHAAGEVGADGDVTTASAGGSPRATPARPRPRRPRGRRGWRGGGSARRRSASRREPR